MTARVVRESYDGGRIEVEVFDFARRPYAHPSAAGRIVLGVIERAMGQATLHLSRDEAMDLAAVLLLAVQDIDATQTAPDGAGAGTPTGETASDQGAALAALLPDGNTRTQAAGPSIPPAEPGRPTLARFPHRAHPFLPTMGHGPAHGPCQMRGCGQPYSDARHPKGSLITGDYVPGVDADPPSVCEHGYRFENALCPVTTCGASAFVEPGSVAAR